MSTQANAVLAAGLPLVSSGWMESPTDKASVVPGDVLAAVQDGIARLLAGQQTIQENQKRIDAAIRVVIQNQHAIAAGNQELHRSHRTTQQGVKEHMAAHGCPDGGTDPAVDMSPEEFDTYLNALYALSHPADNNETPADWVAQTPGFEG